MLSVRIAQANRPRRLLKLLLRWNPWAWIYEGLVPHNFLPTNLRLAAPVYAPAERACASFSRRTR